MAAGQQLASFIQSSFPSVWALELLLLLKRGGDRCWSHEELVTTLRASDLVVSRSVEALLAAGLVVVEADGVACYQPLSAEIDGLASEAEALYAASPDAVRRTIVSANRGGLTAFADAFRYRKD